VKNTLNILQNDSALVALLRDGADSIYVGKAMQTDRAPYVVIVDRMRDPANSSQSGASNAMYEHLIMSFAHDYATVANIKTAIKNALDNATPQTTDGEYMQYIRLLTEEHSSTKEDNIDYFIYEQRFETFLTI
jgi:hypothetical protein